MFFTFFSWEIEFYYVVVAFIVSTLIATPIIHYIQIVFIPNGAQWWRSQSAFYPPPLYNALSILSFIACQLSGRVLTRYLWNGPIYVNRSYEWKDVVIFIVTILILDLFVYWNHRLLHHPLFYRHFHAMHHRVKFVSIWASSYAHPVDYLITAIPYSLLMHSLFPIHYYNDILFAFIVAFVNTVLPNSNK